MFDVSDVEWLTNVGGDTVMCVFNEGDWYDERGFDCEYNNFPIGF